MSVANAIGLVGSLLFIGFMLLGFWRGLRLRPTPPESRAPARGAWMIGF